jgi:hypothetical protein
MTPIYRNKMEPRRGNGVNSEKGGCVTLLAYEGTRKHGNEVEIAVTTCIMHSAGKEIVIKISYFFVWLVLLVAAGINVSGKEMNAYHGC